MPTDALVAALQLWGRFQLFAAGQDISPTSLARFLADYLPPNVMFNVEHKRDILNGVDILRRY